MRKIYHFLGSVSFALILISCTALFVIAGTVLESLADSHAFASHFTYDNPLFSLLLWGFFINILFAALRRRPFQQRHIPFLITHWGLLMILSGLLIKSYWGTQGTMSLIEGSGTHEITLPNTYAIHVEKGDKKALYPIKRTLIGHFKTEISDANHTFPELSLQLRSYDPHGHEHLDSWIKGNHVFVSGLTPFRVHEAHDRPLPVSSRVRMPDGQVWDLIALRTDDVENVAQEAYLEKVPRLLWLQDSHDDVHLFAFDPEGQVFSQNFPINTLNTVVVYDQGYGGYAVQAKIPYCKEKYITLEAPLTTSHCRASPPLKIEDRLPLITLQASADGKTETITLLYDKHAQGLRWPILGGRYVVRFQSNKQDLPYHVRLRQARQINYPNSNQPYSYESDVLITDSNDTKELTLSMNHVHETWDGYRFYLASVYPPTETAVKHVQLTVNQDPAKYWLTYPGASILALGIVLLFWARNKR